MYITSSDQTVSPLPPKSDGVLEKQHQRHFAGISDVMIRCTLTSIRIVFLALFTLAPTYWILSLHPTQNFEWYISLLIFILSLFFFLSLLRKRFYFIWKKHPLSEERERRYSILAGVQWGYLFALPYLFIFPYKVSYNLLFLTFLPLIGICIGAIHPIQGCPAIWKKSVAAVVINFAFLLPLWFVAYVFAIPLTYQEDRFPRGVETFFFHDYYARTTTWMIPKDATDIYIKRDGHLIFYRLKWHCKVSEEAFLAFTKEHDYKLVENDVNYNANENTRKETLGIEGFGIGQLETFEGELPTSFWFYNYVKSNYGGITFLYDRTTDTLYGSYSTN